MLDFKNQTLFLYTTASRDEEGRGEDLVIQAVVSRSGTSFPYFTGGQNEMEGVREGGGGGDAGGTRVCAFGVRFRPHVDTPAAREREAMGVMPDLMIRVIYIIISVVFLDLFFTVTLHNVPQHTHTATYMTCVTYDMCYAPAFTDDARGVPVRARSLL